MGMVLGRAGGEQGSGAPTRPGPGTVGPSWGLVPYPLGLLPGRDPHLCSLKDSRSPDGAYLGIGCDVGTTGANLGQLAICSWTLAQEAACTLILASATWKWGAAGGSRHGRGPGGASGRGWVGRSLVTGQHWATLRSSSIHRQHLLARETHWVSWKLGWGGRGGPSVVGSAPHMSLLAMIPVEVGSEGHSRAGWDRAVSQPPNPLRAPFCCSPGREPCKPTVVSPHGWPCPPSWGRRAGGRVGTEGMSPADTAGDTPHRT